MKTTEEILKLFKDINNKDFKKLFNVIQHTIAGGQQGTVNKATS